MQCTRLSVQRVWRISLTVAVLAALCPLLAQALSFQPIDFSAFHNGRIQDRVSVVPEGIGVLLGGVPFDIPAGGNNEWRGVLAGFQLNVINIPVGIANAHEVHTLVNTDWGSGATSFMLEFLGSNTGYHSVLLVSNNDTRDWNLFFSSTINGTTTIEVARETPGQDGNPDVLDKQLIVLPPDFFDETLVSIRLTDTCSNFVHCAILSGVTVAFEPDSDDNGVLDAADVCPDTDIPEVTVPENRLGVNRWVLVDNDHEFDTTSPSGQGPDRSYNTTNTCGCSCEQIIDELGIGKGHTKFGCSIGAMDEWVTACPTL